jgi:C1A family cysteine protease
MSMVSATASTDNQSQFEINSWLNDGLRQHPEWSYFSEYMQTYNKTYDDEIMRHKFNNFVNNLYFIRAHTSTDYSLHTNKYADLSATEFKSHINAGCYKDTSVDEYSPCDTYIPRVSDPVATLDWRTFGVVTPVKNQGKCGSCWSFSATGAMESAWMLHTGDDISLSEQQLMDCSTAYGNNGCNGGLMPDAFGYAIEYGMCTEQEDPYETKQGNCTYCTPVAKFDSCKLVEPNNELALQDALHNGPVSVAIEADQKAFQFYQGGIIDTPSCGTNLDHGVLAVGFGTDNGKDYWLVKNSWGPEWGEEGYVRISRGNSTDSPGMCGIAMQPSFPVVKDESTIHLCYCI